MSEFCWLILAYQFGESLVEPVKEVAEVDFTGDVGCLCHKWNLFRQIAGPCESRCHSDSIAPVHEDLAVQAPSVEQCLDSIHVPRAVPVEISDDKRLAVIELLKEQLAEIVRHLSGTLR